MDYNPVCFGSGQTIEVINKDMVDAVAETPAGSIDCIIADPPYGETSLEWDRWPRGWPEIVLRTLKPTGSMWVFGSLRMFFENIDEFSEWKMSHEVIWEKQNGTGFAADRFRRVHEMAVHFYPKRARWSDVYKCPQVTMDSPAKRSGRKSSVHTGKIGERPYIREEGGPRLIRSVIFAPNEHGRALHPTQKPVPLVSTLIRYACPIGGRVLDPFAGSGTTGLAARESGMSAVLIERDTRYAEIIKDRLAHDAPLLNGGAN